MKFLQIFSQLVVAGCALSTAAYSHEAFPKKIDLSTQDLKVKVEGSRKEMNKKAFQKKRLNTHDPYPSWDDEDEKTKLSAEERFLRGEDPHLMKNNPEKRFDPKSGKLTPSWHPHHNPKYPHHNPKYPPGF